MKGSSIKAVFADIDGTLYSHRDNAVPPSAADALVRLRENGILVFACTGRHMAEIRDMNMADIRFDGWLTMNGAYCFGRDGFSCGTPLDEDDVRVFAETCAELGYTCQFLEKDAMFMSRYDEEVQKVMDAIHTPMPPIDDPQRALRNTVYMIVPFISEDKWGKVFPLLHHVKWTRWTKLAVDVFHEDTDKEAAIRRTCAYYGWTRNEIAAIGDGPNDVPMMKAAGIAVAMGNAEEDVKKAAGFVTDDVDHDGFRNAMIRLGLIDIGESK